MRASRPRVYLKHPVPFSPAPVSYTHLDVYKRQVVHLSERYITDRYLPDKAIDLLDESCA